MKKVRAAELTLRPDMGPLIVAHLSALGPLPNMGHVAGQAVASAIFELWVEDQEGLVVYNDVDVFAPPDASDHEAIQRIRRASSTVEYQACRIENDGYGRSFLQVDAVYQVVRSSRAGLINRVAYVPRQYHWSKAEELRQLLQGFDLNCTQVGVSLEEQQLVWTPAFERFLKTRQLRVENLQTPPHTAMRWFKKRHDLPGAFGRDQDAMELVSLIAHAKSDDEPRRWDNDHLRWSFGGKTMELYHRFEAELAPFFDMKAVMPPLSTLCPRQTPEQALINVARRYPLRAVPMVFDAWRTPRRKTHQAMAQLLLRHAVQQDRWQKRALTVSLCGWWDQGDAYLAGSSSLDDLSAFEAYAAQRPLLAHAWRGRPWMQQWQTWRQWAALESRYGSWIYGRVEISHRHGEGEYDPNVWAVYLRGRESRSCDDRQRLTSHEPWRGEVLGVNVHELTTRYELMEEGRDLHHCVGGYDDEVRSGRSRIFRLRHRDSNVGRSTLELTYDQESGFWRAQQHRSFYNADPHPELRAASKQLEVMLAKETSKDAQPDVWRAVTAWWRGMRSNVAGAWASPRDDV